jgi:hypothetical protein
MNRQFPLTAAIGLLAALALTGTPALARKPHPAKAAPAPASAPAHPAGKVVDYAELEQHVGDEITVETTLGTLRHGVLVKYTNPALTLQLGPEHGSIELTVPRDTVRNVSVTTPAAPPQDAGSAKKN